MKYIRKKDFERMANEVLQGAENGFICLNEINDLINSIEQINISNVQYLQDAIQALDKVIKNIGTLFGCNMGKSHLSNEMAKYGFSVTRQTLHQWQKSADNIGYKASIKGYFKGDEVDIIELKRFLLRILNDKNR